MPSILARSDTVMLYGGSNRLKTASFRSCENRGTALLNPPNLVKSRGCQLSCQSGSAAEDGLPEKIFTALMSLQPEKLDEEAYGSINLELCPPEEVENVREALKMMARNIKRMHPVRISYFSDCLAFSACSNDVIASQTILDILAKLSIKLWVEHSLLLRGGIAVGKLVHTEGGPFFGPAMNCAYHLESKKANYPRVLVDSDCLARYRTVETFSLFESLFQSDGEFHYMSLGTAYRHIINDSSLVLAGEPVIGKFRTSLAETSARLRALEAQFADERIKEKYRWLIAEIARREPEIRQP